MLEHVWYAITILIILSPYVLGYIHPYNGDNGYFHLDAKASNLQRQDKNEIGNLNVRGESFGNNGNRFGSFIECSHDEQGSRRYFPGGVHLKFSANILDDNQFNATGIWQLSLHPYGTTNAIIKNGTFYSGQVLGGGNEDASRGVTFTLGGIEITDEICGGISKNVIIKASCSEAAPVFYSELDGDKVGSKTPPEGSTIYYLFGNNVTCL
jgi:hypothetical protein